eukprot:1165984-Prorocentrum_minimum.AAC.3
MIVTVTATATVTLTVTVTAVTATATVTATVTNCTRRVPHHTGDATRAPRGVATGSACGGKRTHTSRPDDGAGGPRRA